MEKTTENTFNSGMTDEDWFNLGKSDAWAGKPKAPPEQDSQAASMYDRLLQRGRDSTSTN